MAGLGDDLLILLVLVGTIHHMGHHMLGHVLVVHMAVEHHKVEVLVRNEQPGGLGLASAIGVVGISMALEH